ncbi:MAG: carbohydrate binding domain-containing protein, partial [Armatimonadota bacterium]
MIYRVSVVLLILIFAGTCFAQGENKPEQVITELKPLYRQTTIVTDGEANAVIVIPDSDEYGELARQVQETVKDASGADLPVATDDSIDMDNPPQHLIIIGNMDTNAAAQWLYWRRYVACDLDYPGPDGYVVRTACDPWGTGTNAIMLGGSDMQGIRSAVETFETHVTPGNTLTLPMLMDIHIRNIETIDEAALQKEWDYYREEIIEAGGLWYQVENRIFRLAYDYYLTGIEEYAQMYAAVLPRWFEEYYRFTPHRQLTTPKYQMPDMFLAFDLVEESPAISEELRLEMTNLFLDYAIRMGQGGRVHNWQPGEMRLTGHIPLLSVLYGYQYFTKYYPDQPMELLQQGMDNVRTAMESYTNSVGFMSETGYLCYHPELLLYYSQASGDRTWYETGNALKWEHYHTLVTDNLGAALGKWTPTHLMAARYYEDGRWLWLSNFQRHNDDYTTGVTNGKLVGPRWLGRPDLDPVIPDGLTGLEVFGMTEKWHSELQRQRGELGVEASKAFHQAAMRTSFDRNAQYMRIPGVNVGFHYGTPANAVERLTDRGRSWLVNGRWGMSLPKYYNTMLVVKDGQTYTDLPYLCRLHTATDLPQTGFFQSELPGYTGSDWMRSVVWNKQRYWLIFDSVTAREDAEYTCLCQWRVGRNSQPLLEDAKALVEGGGQHLVIETPESPSMAVLPEGPLNAPPSSYMYRQGITRSLAAGDSADFCNLLWVKGGSAVIDGWRRWQSSAQTAFPTTENPHTGDMALQLNNTGEGWQCLNQKLDLAPGETYRATGWARTNGKLGAVIQIRDEAADNVMIGEIRTDAEEWTKLELEFEAPAEGQNPQIWLLHHHYNAPEGVAWFDDISVVAADGPEDNLVTNGGFESSGDAWRVSAEYSVRGLDDGCVIVSDGEEYWISGASGDGEARQFNPAESVSVTARAFQQMDLIGATDRRCYICPDHGENKALVLHAPPPISCRP